MPFGHHRNGFMATGGLANTMKKLYIYIIYNIYMHAYNIYRFIVYVICIYIYIYIYIYILTD